MQALLRDTTEVTKDDFVHSAGLIAGSPVYFGVMAAELKKIFDDYVGTRKRWKTKWGRPLQLRGILPEERKPP